MSTEGGHLGWRFGSLDIILKVDHLRTIHAMFALNWLTGFREKKILTFFPYGPTCMLKLAWMVLKWSIFKIVSGDPDLHPRWPPSADIL
jgi:hypothetical protein